MQDIVGDPRLEQQPHSGGSDQRGLLGGLGDDSIAGGERRGDLAGEDRQRKIPRRDAREDAAPAQLDLVALAGGAGQGGGAGKIRPRADRVITQVIDRLAHLGERVRDRAAAFPDDQRHQLRHPALVQIGRGFEVCGALACRDAVPQWGAAHRPSQGPIDIRQTGHDHLANLAPPVTRVEHGLGGAALLDAGNDRRRSPGPPQCRGKPLA